MHLNFEFFNYVHNIVMNIVSLFLKRQSELTKISQNLSRGMGRGKLARLAILVSVLVLSIGGRAGTVTVQNANDSGTGSLRAAVSEAASGSIINFSSNFTIQLITTIVIDKDLVIDGSGKNITISGGGATSLFNIVSGNVEIKDLTLRDGLAKGDDGEINGKYKRHGAGGGGAGMGGAIAVRDSVVLIDGVEFIVNKAKGGNGGDARSPNAETTYYIKTYFSAIESVYGYAGAGGGSIFGSGGSRLHLKDDAYRLIRR